MRSNDNVLSEDGNNPVGKSSGLGQQSGDDFDVPNETKVGSRLK